MLWRMRSTSSEQSPGGARWLLLWVVALAGAIAVLTVAGRGALATPSLFGGVSWREWAAQRDALMIIFALLRLATLGVAWYLLGATVVGVAARLASWRGLVRVADTLTVPSVRRLLQSALGVGLASAAITVGSGASGLAPTPSTPSAVLTAAGDDSDADVEVMVPVGEAAVMLPFEPTPADAADRTWTVQPGDHFWSIAADVLRQQWGRAPTDKEVAPYWERLVQHNRGRLVDRGNPDLIIPDQVFQLPRPPAAPEGDA